MKILYRIIIKIKNKINIINEGEASNKIAIGVKNT